jgi:menaquinone-dependent protoporphyrinogen oxidase
MKVLVAYASKYGSTKGIAEFIAEKLRLQGVEVEIQKVDSVRNPGDYGALVIGSSVYMGHWMKEASELVMRNRDALSSRPVWLFSSGPLGNNASANDPKSEPKEIAEFRETINPRDHRVFFGAFDRKKLGFKDRMVAMMPAARALFPEGDFRNWNDIEAWASNIARALETPHTEKEEVK